MHDRPQDPEIPLRLGPAKGEPGQGAYDHLAASCRQERQPWRQRVGAQGAVAVGLARAKLANTYSLVSGLLQGSSQYSLLARLAPG